MNEKAFPACSFRELTDVMETLLCYAKHVLILTHVNPDGDCIGSAAALCEMFRACGREASVIVNGPLPHRLAFLTGDQTDFSLADGEEKTADAILTVDVASPMQLGALGRLIPQVTFMIDHHGVGEPFAPGYIDPTASSAGEIVGRLYFELKRREIIPAIPAAAAMIYAAIASDTGSFRFSNTTPDTLRLTADLVEELRAADGVLMPDEICRLLFEVKTARELTAEKIALEGLRFWCDGRIAGVLFTQQMLADAGLTDEDIGNIVDVPRCVEGVLVALSVRQTAADPTKYKVSSRANAELDCASVCRSFGGGGHTRAAGCTITAASAEEAMETAAAAFSALIG